MSSKVDAALKAREEKRKKELEESKKKREDKISAALAARDARIKGNLQSTLTDLNDRIKAEAEALKKVSTPSWGSDSYKSTVESTRESRINVEKLQREVEALRKYIGDEDTDRVLSSIGGMSTAYTSYLEAAEVYSHFDSEDEYNRYLQQQKDTAAKLDFDLDAGQAEIDTLKANRAEIDELLAELKSMGPSDGKYMNPTQLQANSARLEAITARLKELGADDDGAIAGIDATISEKERYLREARRLQEWQVLGAVGDSESEYYDPDFAKYAELGESKGLETHSAFAGTDGIKQTLGSDVNDRIIAFRNNRNEDGFPLISALGGMSNSNPYEEEIKFAQYMTDEQFETYSYYYGKYGAKEAKEYLKSIEEQVNAQQAGSIFGTLEDKWALELFFGVAAGLDQFATGMENLFSKEDYIPQSAVQMASQMVREDLGESDFKILGSTIGQIAYDATTTTANMLPSILTSAAIGFVNPGAGAVVGAGLLGASASGNAYAEMLNLGYSKGQARNYAALVGGSEAVLQYILGGIGQLGGKLTGNALTKVVSKIDNAFARVAIKLGGDMASEGLEEGLQTVLEAWFKSEVTGMDFDAPDIDEVLYSSLLGALSAAGIGGVSTIGGEAIANIQAKKKYGGAAQDLINEAREIGTADALHFADKYQPLLDKGKSLTGAQLNRLIESNQKGIPESDIKKISTAAEARLTELGEMGDVEVIASALAKQVAGEKLSLSEKAALLNSKYSQRVANELDRKKAKSGQYTSGWVQDIGTDSINDDIYNLAEEVAGVAKDEAKYTIVNGELRPVEQTYFPRAVYNPNSKTTSFPMQEAMAKAKAEGATENTPAKQIAAESVLEASDNGKTIYNGEEVTIKGIDSVKDGKVTLRLDSGATVNASEVSFGSQEEAMVYEMVARMGVGAETANELVAGFATGNTPAMMYVADAPLAYQYGKINFERGLADLHIPEAQKRIAYNRGRLDAMTDASDRANAPAVLKTPSMKPKKNGIIYEDFEYDAETATDIQKASIQGIEALAKLSPTLEFHVYRSELKNGKRVASIDGVLVEAAPNGYFTAGNKIYIDLNAGNGGAGTMLYTVSHEIGHYIRQWNAKGFKVLGDFLLEQYSKKGVPVDALIQRQKTKIKQRLKREGKALPSESKLFDMAYEEMVCDAMSSMFADPKAYEKLAELKMKNPNVFKKLGEAIKKILDKLKSLLGIYSEATPDALEADYISKFAPEVYEKLQDLYLKAFVEAEANHESAERTLGESGIMVESTTVYSVREEYASEIDEWSEDGMPDGETFVLGTTGDILQGLGAIENDIYLLGDKIKKILADHPEMTLDEIKKIPQILENPILVLKSRNVGRSNDPNTRLVLFGSIKAKNGKPILSVMDLRPIENHIVIDDMQKVTSAYTKTTAPIEFIRNSYVLYADKNKATSLLRSIGFQMPIELNKSGFVGSISYKGRKVNIFGEKFSDVFGEGSSDGDETRVTDDSVNRKNSDRETAEFSDADTQYSIREEAPPKKTVEVYKLMRLKDGKIYPLFIDSTEPLEKGTWYDADSPNLDFLKKLPSGIFLVDTDNESYTTFADYLAESGEKKTKFPSKQAIEKAAADGLRWVYIEETEKGQKRFGGETRKYWNLGINGSGAVSTFSMRPGYHAGSLPSMRQIGKGPNRDLRDDSFVWTVGEVPADIDYQAEADSNPDKDIPTHIPVNGYYLKATNADKAKSQADVIGWYVAGSYKINRIISDKEARRIIDEWNAKHPDAQAQYDYDRESGMDFDADSMSLVPRDDTKFSEREVVDISTAEYVKMYHHFGSTKNYEVAGYLLKNGIMLDFSGKHWGDDYSTSRQVDHRDVQEVLDNRGNNGINAMIDMIGNGNIRLMPEVGGVCLAVKPNETQMSVLRGYFNHFKGEVVVDIDKVGGDTIHSFSYTRGTSSSKIIGDIKAYFDEGVVPQKKADDETDIRQFLYSDRDSDSISTRSLLANALEGAAQNDIERQKLAQYKQKISLIEAEQAKLSEIRRQIRELFFAKGPRDEAKIRSLKFDEKQTANRINTYDRQLLNLQATTALKNVLEREKKLAYDKAKKEGKEAMAAYREKVATTQRELITRWQDSRKKAVEGRNKTEMKRKIRKAVKSIDSILNNGTKERNVKEEMREVVASSLALADVLFSDEIRNEDIVRLGVESVTDTEEKLLNEYANLLARMEAMSKGMDSIPDSEATLAGALAKIGSVEEELAKIKNRISTLDRKLSDVFKRERARLNKTTISQLIEQLAGEYLKLKTSPTDYIRAAYDEFIYQRLDVLKEDIGGAIVKDMSIDQLAEVYGAYKMVEHFVRTANKAFKAKKGETIQTIANRVMEEVDKLEKKRLFTKMGKRVSAFNWNNQKPIYAFERIGSDTLTDVFDGVRAGEDVWAVDITEAKAFLTEQMKKYGYDSWDFDKKYAFTSSTGKNFELTLGQIMSLYAYSKRGPQAVGHLEYGGFKFDDITEVKVKTKFGIEISYELNDTQAYKLGGGILDEIIKVLDDEEVKGAKDFVDVMQDYLSKTMGAKGNEVSLELYGISQFTEEHYFPLRTAPQFLERAREQATQTAKIKNKGFTKATIPNAHTTIVLSSFMDVWTDHVNEMSMYHAFALPMEDLYRVYNYKTSDSDSLDTEGVVPSIQGAHGIEATQYIDQLLKDLSGGARSDPRETWGKALMSKFKKAAVMASASVVVQQPTAIVRAMALVDAKYFRAYNPKKHNALWAEVKKYAPVAIIKEMGYFDTNMGRSTKDYLMAKEYSGIKEKAKAIFTDGNYRDEILSRLPALADELGWISIWEAVKRETISKYKNLSPISEEFLKKVGERFTEVVTKTQVYDSVLARSGMMRSKSGLVNMWTSFMGEPTTSLNMLQDALLKGKRGDKKYAARAIGAVYGSVILNALLVSFVYAARDDDDDETYIEKYLARLTTEILDGINPLTYIPIVKDAWSIAQGFDIERADMAIITDLVDSLQQTVQVISKDTDDMDEEELKEHHKQVAGALWSIADNISSLVGIPVKNLRREVIGSLNFGKTLWKDFTDRDTSFGSLMDEIWEDVKDTIPVVGWLPDESKADKLYDAIVSGDEAYRKRLEGGYDTKSKLDNAIRKGLRENDPRIKEAAEARMKGDISKYMRIAKSIITEGHFSQDNVVAAINAEISAMSKGETTSTTSKEKGIFEMKDYYAAIVGRDQATAAAVKEDIIRTDVKNGEERDEAEKSFSTSFATHVGKQYKEGNLSDREAANMLTEYADMSEDEAESKVQYWDFKQEYPDYELTEAAVAKYYSDVKPSGISVEVYYDYTKKRAKCEGTDSNGDGKTDSGSVKRGVLMVINSLPISASQKDALYFAEGWAASKLYEAPWR